MGRLWPTADRQLAPWLDDTALKPGSEWQRKPPDEFPPPWACGWGHDVYGLWYRFSINGVEQCMRWIPPGEFTMGSPDTEPERRVNESLHHVTLSRGFWLADTACTQELWQVVTQQRPSKFKGESLPVENISRNDANTFCEQLNQSFPGFDACLPSEAQWEYACRAGSKTAFWWGDTLSMEQANYDGGVPYAKGKRGKSADETVDVTKFVRNPWGLYQIHGNVYEWCNDWYGDYPNGAVVDPTVLATGDGRVLRGGCWVSSGRWLRAADRRFARPDYRFDFAGFRLAQVPDSKTEQ